MSEIQMFILNNIIFWKKVHLWLLIATFTMIYVAFSYATKSKHQ